MSKTLCLLFAFFALAMSTSAQGPGGPQPRLVLEAIDTNHDGALSPDEIKAASKTLLALDRNNDGALTPDELSPRPDVAGASASELTNQLIAFDRNHDGVLTPDELPDRMQALFQRADANHDGKLTPAEINLMAQHQGMPNGPRTAPGRAEGNMRQDPVLNALDADHDGTISASEIANAPAALATLDKNGDGTLSPDELRPRPQTAADRAEHFLGENDTNKDGKISKEEAPDRIQQVFSSVDKNNDGFLDKDELTQYFSTQPTGPQGGGPRPQGNDKEQK